jgi:phage protein D
MEQFVKVPKFKILYQGKNITQDISKDLISVTYTDATEDESDELELSIADPSRKWISTWAPRKGDKIDLSIGYDQDLMPCGTFTIDQIDYTISPAVMQIRALAAATDSPLRTKRSRSFEKQTLRQIAQRIATEQGLQLQGDILDITIDRTTQSRETDLKFLHRIATQYGYVFSIRDKKLIFTSIFKLEAGKPVFKLDLTDLISGSLRDKSVKTFKAAKVTYHNPKKKEVVSKTVSAGGSEQGTTIGGANDVTSADTLEIHTKAENEQQAEVMATAALHKANTTGQEGRFTVIGNQLLVAGNNIEMTGIGEYSGLWHIKTSTHRIDRSGGYITEFEGTRLIKPTPAQQTPKKIPPRPRKKPVNTGRSELGLGAQGNTFGELPMVN